VSNGIRNGRETMKNIWNIGFMMLLALFLFSGCDRKGDDQIVMKIACVLPSSHPTTEALLFFEERLESLSDNRIDVQVYPNGLLGNAHESIIGCQMGNVEIAVVSSAVLGDYEDMFKSVSLPFVFESSEHQKMALEGEAGRVLKNSLSRLNLSVVAFFNAGSRNIMNKFDSITVPKDLEGMKIRVMDSAVLLETLDILGAAPIAMSQGEVYGALETGVIDGWENNPATCLAFSMYETGCIYFSWTKHTFIPDVMIVGKRFIEKIPADLKVLIERASDEASAQQRIDWREYEANAITKLKSKGMVFNEVNLNLFREKAEPLYNRAFEEYGQAFTGLVKSIRKANDVTYKKVNK